MALIVDARQQGAPGVHAVLIGVGCYPHLLPGHPLGQYAPEAGLPNLESPLHAVTALANWLASEMTLQGKPLRTLRVLGSSPTTATPWPDSEPTFQNIQGHVHDWYDDVDTHEQNLAVFYFCGHGLRIGAVQALLAQDFGSNSHLPFSHAIEPEQFARAMGKARALQQVFLIDACSTTLKLPEDYEEIQPSSLIQAARNDNLGLTRRAFIRASEFGTSAYGVPGAPSVFMTAFLTAMRGAAAVRRTPTEWVANTDVLKTAANWLIQQTPHGVGQEVAYGGGLSSTVDLHELPGVPLLPVQVTCDPSAFEALAELHVDQLSKGGQGHWPANVELPLGNHDFQAIESTSAGKTVHGELLGEYVFPPYGLVSIPCGGTP